MLSAVYSVQVGPRDAPRVYRTRDNGDPPRPSVRANGLPPAGFSERNADSLETGWKSRRPCGAGSKHPGRKGCADLARCVLQAPEPTRSPAFIASCFVVWHPISGELRHQGCTGPPPRLAQSRQQHGQCVARPGGMSGRPDSRPATTLANNATGLPARRRLSA